MAERSITDGWIFVRGAMYLFTINTIFIALATFLVLKLLRFPMLKYANSAKRKRIARIASLVAIVVMIYPIITFLSVLRESQFTADAKRYINTELKNLPNANYIKKNAVYVYNPDAVSRIEITTFGSDEISGDTKKVLEGRFSEYSRLDNTELVINQATYKNANNSEEYMKELLERDSLELMNQRQKISYLENKVRQLSKLERNQIPFEEVSQEVKINYDNIETLSFANVIKSNFSTIDTIPVFQVKWKDSVTTPETIIKDNAKLNAWLKLKLKLDTLVIKNVE